MVWLGKCKPSVICKRCSTALVADSVEELCRFVSEFGRVYEIRKFRVNIDKRKVMRCCMYLNEGRIYVRRNGEPLERK